MSLLDVVCIFGDSLNTISDLPFYLWILDVSAQALTTRLVHRQYLSGFGWKAIEAEKPFHKPLNSLHVEFARK